MAYLIITDRRGNIFQEKTVTDPWKEVPGIQPKEKWSLSSKGTYHCLNQQMIISPSRTKAYDLLVQLISGVH